MAFWGIEVKPGKPFTHTADDARGRLHISQATLGIGTTTKRSVVQCNVGNKSPVFLCSLFPEKAESCQLNLEFEEADEVVFSVIGPRSVHLTGYFMGSGRHYNLNYESESYGEDIADTETERSAGHSDEDKYEDSFIDDDEPEVFPSSPVSDGEETEETPDRSKPNTVKGSHRRLRKKYQLSESDDDVDGRQHMVANGTAQDSEGEDLFPISSLCKVNTTTTTTNQNLEAEEKIVKKDDTHPTKNKKSEAEEKADKKNRETSNGDAKDEGQYSPISERKVDVVVSGEPKRPNLDDSKLPSMEVGHENGSKPKKKKKERSKEGKYVDTDAAGCCNDLEEDKTQRNDTESDKMVQTLPVRNEENQEASNHDSKGAGLPIDFLPPSIQVGSESAAALKKRKRKERAEEKIFKVDSDYHINLNKEDNTLQDELTSESVGQDLPARNEYDEKQANDKNFENDVQSAGENQPEEKKKKKKKRRTNEDKKVMDTETPQRSMDAKSGSVMDTENRSADSNLSQLKTLSGGVVIEEIEMGKPDGKIAASGKKISVSYTGKLKENGQVFDSNLGGTPLKFRLGGKEVIDGFNIGLEGMRVGGKRRILIPPSMRYASEGDGKNVPANSWLVFDVELVKVHR